MRSSSSASTQCSTILPWAIRRISAPVVRTADSQQRARGRWRHTRCWRGACRLRTRWWPCHGVPARHALRRSARTAAPATDSRAAAVSGPDSPRVAGVIQSRSIRHRPSHNVLAGVFSCARCAVNPARQPRDRGVHRCGYARRDPCRRRAAGCPGRSAGRSTRHTPPGYPSLARRRCAVLKVFAQKVSGRQASIKATRSRGGPQLRRLSRNHPFR